MCNPVVLLAASAAVTVGGQLYGARQQRKQNEAQAASYAQQQAAYEEQARQVEESAAIYADQTRDEALQQAKLIRDAATKVRATTRAAIGASGVRVGEGSAATAEEEVVFDSEQDAAMTILTGERQASAVERGAAQEAYSLRSSGVNAGMAAAAQRQAASNATTAGWINATSTVLGAAATAGRWNSLMNPNQTRVIYSRGGS